MTINEPVLDHAQRTEVSFLAGLEHELHGSRKLRAVLVQQLHGTGQHGRVRIMTARMHAARLLRLEGQVSIFRHWQSIHVTAQQHRASLGRSRESDDHARR